MSTTTFARGRSAAQLSVMVSPAIRRKIDDLALEFEVPISDIIRGLLAMGIVNVQSDDVLRQYLGLLSGTSRPLTTGDAIPANIGAAIRLRDAL